MTAPQGPLTDEQLRSFRADGYLHIPALIPAEELIGVQRDTFDLIQKGIDEQIDDPTYCYGADAQDRGRKCLFRINDLIAHHGHESFKLLLAFPPLLHAIHQAVSGDHFVSSVHSTVFKVPRRGYPVPWHQDPVTVMRFPVFNVDIYLDEGNPGNGGLYAIPGSHLAGYHGDPAFVHSWTKGREEDAPGAVPVLTQPGDVVFHATSVLHGSFWNRSDSLRRTIYFHIDHMEDARLQAPDSWLKPRYLPSQEIVADAIAIRAAKHAEETPFPYWKIDANDLG